MITTIITHDDGSTSGVDPRRLSPDELTELGHPKMSILKVIREKCADCAGGTRGEARRCTAVDCPLWPYRYGTNPHRNRIHPTERGLT